MYQAREEGGLEESTVQVSHSLPVHHWCTRRGRMVDWRQVRDRYPIAYRFIIDEPGEGGGWTGGRYGTGILLLTGSSLMYQAREDGGLEAGTLQASHSLPVHHWCTTRGRRVDWRRVRYRYPIAYRFIIDVPGEGGGWTGGRYGTGIL